MKKSFSLGYTSLDFVCSFTSKAELPEFKGSAIRGSIGHSLKKVVCALRHQECSSCMLQNSCLYFQTFENNRNEFINPYVLDFSLETKRDYQVDDRIKFSLNLFGDVAEKVPYFIYSIIEMGSNGIGKEIEGKRGSFVVESVSSNGELVYSNDKKVVDSIPRIFIEEPKVENSVKVDCMKIIFVTPLRVKEGNLFVDKITFELLIKSVLRRISQVWKQFVGKELELEYRQLIEDSKRVKVFEDNTFWKDWTRYSSRQKEKLKIGGVMGDITFVGQLSSYYALLKTAEKLHLGKQTSFGLGKIKIEN